MIEAKMTEQRLSDGSKVYNVVLRQRFCRELTTCLWGDDAETREFDDTTLVLPANSAGDADHFVAEFVAMVKRHTAEEAKRTD